MANREARRKMAAFLSATSEKARVGKCCQILIKQLCHNCVYAKEERVLLRKIKQPDIDKPVCVNCIKLMYVQAYGRECECIK